jgi:DNA uptake protein ComE-like DNA-binding protein
MRFVLSATAASTLVLGACSSPENTAEAPAEDAAAATAVSTPAAQAAASDAVLDANSATAEQLAAAPGMTPALAAAVVAGRPYAGAAAFKAKLAGTLDEAAVNKVLESVFVPVDLNSASKADIEAIPGMTPKMVHELEEYRPYENMAEFDREIGKYVDAAEVARLRSYVTL